MYIVKKSYLLLLLMMVVQYVDAQVSLVAKAPATVAVGEQFRLQYSVNSAGVSRAPQLSSIPNFHVLYGPAISTSQSFQSVNGRTTQNSSTVFTFTLVAEKEGKFSLPSVTLSVDGKNYTSNRPQVTVVKSSGNSSARASQSGGGNRATQPAVPRSVPSASSVRNIDPSDLYISVSANKHEVYEQEPLLLSYNVYTNLMLEQLQGKMPDLKGFVAKEIPLPKQKNLTLTRHNGRTIQTTVWSQYVMFPQQSGNMTIPSIPFEGVIAFPNRNVDPVDAFFFGTSPVSRVSHTVKAPSLNIKVKPLPERPIGFSGAVGSNFSVTSSLTTKNPRENETFNLRLVISGLGNIDLITPPEVEFPSDFETFDPATTANVELTTQGMKGELLVDYTVIPNHQGTYVIPPVKFIYFSPQDGKYHTITTPNSITVKVAKGSPNSYAARMRMKNDDIRPIHTGEIEETATSVFWFGWSFWLLYLILIIAGVLLWKYSVLFTDRRGIFYKGLVTKSKKSRIPLPEDFKDTPTEYYLQMLSFLKKVVADRCQMPFSSLTRERLKQVLDDCAVDQQCATGYFELTDLCELYTYGQITSSAEEMQEVYNKVKNILPMLTKQLGKKKKTHAKATMLLLLMLFFAQGAFAVTADAERTKAVADSLYNAHLYEKAQESYARLIKIYPNSPQLLYNMANCYYRQKQIPQAILYYERALVYNPSNDDARHNLTLSRAQTQDKFYSASDLDLVYSFNSFVNTFSIDGWAWLSVTLLLIAVCLFVLIRVLKPGVPRRVLLIVIPLLLIGIVLANVFAAVQTAVVSNRSGAIIMNTTNLYGTPDTTGTTISTLHGGTKVELTDTTLPLWSEVSLPNGMKGWIKNSDKENI